QILILIFIAACLAAGIAPAVHWVRVRGRYWLGRSVSRGVAVMIVYFPFLAPRLIVETRALGAQLPSLIETNILIPLERFLPMDPVRDYLRQGIGLPHASVFSYVKTVATAVASIVAVAFMIAYMLVDAARLRNTILLFYPPE